MKTFVKPTLSIPRTNTNRLAPPKHKLSLNHLHQIHTTVQTGRNSQTLVAPAAKVHTVVQAHPNTVNIIKPNAKLLTNVNTRNISQTTVKLKADVSTTVNTSTHSKTYVKSYTIVKTICELVLKSVPPETSKDRI
jgi:hypothetical protein